MGGTHRVAALDGIRGIAILGVLGAHTGLLPGGEQGVTVFFVLSGYLITSLLLAEHDRTGRIALRRFYRRRFARLAPAFLTAATATTSLAALPYAPEPLGRVLRGQLAPALGYVANIAAAAGHRLHALGWLTWTWSLSIEEQFYLLWPGMLVLAVATRRRWLYAFAGAGIGWSVVLRVVWSGDPHRVYFGTDTRMDGLLVGCLLAFALRGGRPSPTVARWAGVVGLLAVAAAYLATFPAGFGSWLAVWLPVVDVASVGLIVAATQDTVVARLLSARWLAALGVVSYSVYLWHLWPSYAYAAATGAQPPLLVTTAVGVALGAASYRWLERPARAWLSGSTGAIRAANGTPARSSAVMVE